MGLPDRSPALSALLTERLVLEPWEESRRKDLTLLATIPEVVRHIGDGKIWSRERADEVFDQNIRHWNEHGFGCAPPSTARPASGSASWG
jgi:RimJ/RimL family protein N-acetyltransferase